MSTAPEAPPIRGGPIVERRITEELAAFCAATTLATLPQEAIEATRRLALDFAGVALRGSLEPSSRAVVDAIERLEPQAGPGTIIGRARKAAPAYAALANGTALHGLELDDIHPLGGVHAGGPIFATAFAVGEACDARGDEMLAAAVLGYEVSCRLGIALPFSLHGAHGFHATGTCGAFAAAIVAAKLLRLDEGRMVDALGIAGSQAAASLEYRTEGAWTKRFHPGWAAHSGIVAAELARSGFNGPHRIIEGRAGFLRSYSDEPRADLVLDELGSRYEVLRTAAKPYAACRYSQGTIDAMLELVYAHDVKPSDVERVTIGLFKNAFPSVAEPMARKRHPVEIMDAQFSAYFAAAAVLLWRQVTVAEYQPGRLDAPELHELMDRIECVHAPELDALFPRFWPTKVDIHLRNGRTLSARADRLKGDPDNPLSWGDFVAKFDGLAAELLTSERRNEVVAVAGNLERHDVRDLTKLLSTER